MTKVIWYWIDTKWACGGVKTRDGICVGGAPIFKKFKGQEISKLSHYYTVKQLKPLRRPKET